MSKRDFIRKHRRAIDDHIKAACPNCGRLNDEEREMWIMNDESLYNWAKREGVNV